MADPNSVVPISELNRLVRLSIEREFPLLWVAGEISNLTRAASGHFYFSLKDAAAQVRCVMFRSRAQAIPWRLENGQQVEARALVSLYEPRGDFQLGIESLRRDGLGSRFEALARLKAQLQAEGLFATEGKKAMPRFPRRIGIISSPHAAALQDIIAAIKRRTPHLTVILYPTLVQGDAAATGVASAIATAGRRNECDLLLIVRGGGSIEDLWAFNDEMVARAIAASPLPTISGVGHETDTTIADYVADLRAATPTAAAELATQGWHDAAGNLEALDRTLRRAIGHQISRQQQKLDHFVLQLVHPATRMQRARDALALLGARMDATFEYRLRGHRENLNRAALAIGRKLPRTDGHRGRTRLLSQRLHAAFRNQRLAHAYAMSNLATALEHLNPEATLARGFSIVRDTSGCVITDISQLHAGQTVCFQLAKGSADASILTMETGPQ